MTRAESEAFIEGLGVAALVCGLAIRMRLLAASPLPSAQPIRWLLAGAADDLALLALGAGLALLVGRAWPRLARGLYAAWASALGLSLLVWSDVLVYFGHPPRGTDLSVGADAGFVARSTDRWALLRLLAVALFFAAAIRVAARRKKPALRAGPAAGVAVTALALALAPLPVSMRATARHPLFSLASLAGARAWQRELIEPPPAFRPLPASGSPGAGAAPLPRPPSGPRLAGAPRVPEGVKPNVVFVLLEGVRSEELGAWGGLKDLSPHLDDLARHGVRVDRAFSPGTHTPEGELALWYGLLASPRRLILTEAPDEPGDGLPEILRRAGWRSFLWIFGGDQTFYRRERFYVPRGLRMVDGRDLDAEEPRTNWGYSDKVLVRAAVRAIDRLDTPFAAMVLTVSNHHPFQVPADAVTSFTPPPSAHGGFVSVPGLPELLGLHTGPMLRTIHYADEALGDFFALAERRPWYARTIFVVCGDHGLPIAPLSGTPTAHRFASLRHQVPLVLFSPLFPGGLTLAGPASLADVPATLLGFLGSREGVGDGHDLFEEAPSTRPVIAWDDEGRTVTAATRAYTYHATLAPDGTGTLRAADESLFAAADSAGANDLAQKEPETVAFFRASVLSWAGTRP
ncbi:MAG: LTA synthase family protein [Thermoanaerobaculia bacterium]